MTEQQGPCSRCGYGGKHLEAPPCAACPAQPKGEEKNTPLTIDELRWMSGEPVWLVPLGEGFDEGWYIIVSNDKQRLRCLPLYSILFFEHYGKTWLAYRRKPEEGTK